MFTKKNFYEYRSQNPTNFLQNTYTQDIALKYLKIDQRREINCKLSRNPMAEYWQSVSIQSHLPGVRDKMPSHLATSKVNTTRKYLRLCSPAQPPSPLCTCTSDCLPRRQVIGRCGHLAAGNSYRIASNHAPALDLFICFFAGFVCLCSLRNSRLLQKKKVGYFILLVMQW